MPPPLWCKKVFHNALVQEGVSQRSGARRCSTDGSYALAPTIASAHRRPHFTSTQAPPSPPSLPSFSRGGGNFSFSWSGGQKAWIHHGRPVLTRYEFFWDWDSVQLPALTGADDLEYLIKFFERKEGDTAYMHIAGRQENVYKHLGYLKSSPAVTVYVVGSQPQAADQVLKSLIQNLMKDPANKGNAYAVVVSSDRGYKWDLMALTKGGFKSGVLFRAGQEGYSKNLKFYLRQSTGFKAEFRKLMAGEYTDVDDMTDKTSTV